MSTPEPKDFLREQVTQDTESKRFDGRVVTRFPPEPNGYLHIGHAKAICIDFGIAQEFGGYCNLRYDDTNPTKEDQEYVDAIEYDIKWLGFQWQGEPKFASDYFEQLYDWAVELIQQGKAYVDDLSMDEIRESRANFPMARASCVPRLICRQAI
jgi:glutaminyl-tRNA synthetase